MTLPALLNWDTTRTTLHQAAQVIGAVRAGVAAPEPNWAHLGLRVAPEGLWMNHSKMAVSMGGA